ncbi:MAG: T9SS type A sorting domain-containing protein [Bacteroidales bacterium]|nr:T9SS type A sorting domain-containing protein [Bacteroidales bacterium]
MKKLTLFALALGLTFGVFAQGLTRQNATLNTPMKFKTSMNATKLSVSAARSMAKTVGVEFSNFQFAEEGLFTATFDVTMNAGTEKYFFLYMDTDGSQTLSEYVQAQLGVTLAQYIDTLALQYATYYGVDIFETEGGSQSLSDLVGSTSYEIAGIAIGAGDTVEFSTTFTTPASSRTGEANLTITKQEYVEDGEIFWTIMPNDQTAGYYFLCEPKDSALFWLENYPDQIANEQASYEQELSYWVSGQYSSYFSFGLYDDVNEVWSTSLLSSGAYEEGETYVYIWAAYNGMLDMTGITAVEFVYGGGTVSLNEVADFASMSVYPNPATDFVTLNSKVNITKVELYNVNGQVVYSSDVNANNVTVSTANLENGTYFVKAYANGMTATKKVVVR